jgi:two-component system, chemotaxis family, response regulator WspF
MRVAIVNDSLLAREVIRRSVLVRPDVTIAWVATNGAEAIERCCNDRPDLILMDLVMPNVDGVTATAHIMRECPCPILIVTVSIDRNATPAFAAMGAGAVDVMALPDDWRHGNELLQKISQIERLHQPLPFRSRPRNLSSTTLRPGMPLILIGASAGGPVALAELLGSLPREFAAGIVLAQHLDARFADEFIRWLQKQTPLRVRRACQDDAVEAGTVLVSSENRNLVFQGDGRLGYTREPVSYHVPSIDALFFSANGLPGAHLAAVLLTGMGADGAAGMKALRESGHLTIAQDETSSALYGMPRAAARLGAAREILPLAEIAPRLRTFVCRMSYDAHGKKID